jgi:hypothetical protein
MSEEQVRLLHKLQMAEIPAFAEVNPLTMGEDEASDYFRMNLPPLEWIKAVGETKEHEFVEAHFIGVSENNCRTQMQKWLEREDLTLFQQPNPQFGTGGMWLEYFSQPMSSVNLKALEDSFKKWEISVPQIPVPKEQQKIDHYKPKVAEQAIYQRLSPTELQKELENLKSGQELSPDVSLGFAPGDLMTFEDDTTFHTFLSPLAPLAPVELQSLSEGKPVENLTGQELVNTVHSDVSLKPYYARLSEDEIQQEIEHFQETGTFRSGISIGHDSGTKSKSDKSVDSFVIELSDQELDQLESGIFQHPEKLLGQKLLGYTNSQDIEVFRRLTPEELAAELELYAKDKKFSSPEISLGHLAVKETYKKEFHRPLQPLSEADLTDLVAGKPISNQDILYAQKLVCRTPEIPPAPVYETKFSALELAFEDCGEDRIELYLQHRKILEEKTINKVTPAQRAMIKALQATGKGPKIDRDAYLSLKNKDAAAYIQENENNPENTFEATAYPQHTKLTKDAAFPEFKKANLFSQEQADYLQRSIIRDLAAEGHIATPETLPELLDKLELITSSQAKDLIEPHFETPAGSGLLNQCKAYIDSGKIHNPGNIATIADVYKLYQTHRGLDFDMKAAMRDLVDGGYIRTDDGLAKVKFTTAAQDAELIAKYGDVPAGNNLRARIFDLINDAKIGNLDDDQFKQLKVREAMQIIAQNAELEHFKNQSRASKGQKKLLQKMEARGSINLQKINLERLTFKAADQLIKQNLRNAPSRTKNATATAKQRAFIKVLVAHQLVSSMPYSEWKDLTLQKASQLIASVPEEQRKSLASQSHDNPRTPAPQPAAPER